MKRTVHCFSYWVFVSLVFPWFVCSSCTRIRLLSGVAIAAGRPVGAPGASDVCFSSRWEHPRNEQDTFETFSAARSFFATHLLWVYSNNPAFIRKADSLGFRIQLALSPTLTDMGSETSRELGRMISVTGKRVTAPWMRDWEFWWGCVNHQDFRKSWWSRIQQALEAGAYGFQVDDPAFSVLLLRNNWEEVCYCPWCRRLADSLQVSPPEIQEKSVVDFHRSMQAKASEFAGRHVPFSCNNFRGEWELFPFREFDFGIAELPERRANPEYLYASLRETGRLNKAQVFSFANDRTWLVQKVIATTYACGGNPLVPWDVWMGNGRERYFGKVADYAPFFGFARGIGQWLNGYSDAFYANSQDETRYVVRKKLPVHFDHYRRQVHAFVRAKPGKPHAPIVIHLVDWEVLTQPFTLRLAEKAFFKKGIGKVEVLRPRAYDPALHQYVADSGAFELLAETSVLDTNSRKGIMSLDIPALQSHWAVLVVYEKER